MEMYANDEEPQQCRLRKKKCRKKRDLRRWPLTLARGRSSSELELMALLGVESECSCPFLFLRVAAWQSAMRSGTRISDAKP